MDFVPYVGANFIRRLAIGWNSPAFTELQRRKPRSIQRSRLANRSRAYQKNKVRLRGLLILFTLFILLTLFTLISSAKTR